jgi:hypothetical protein
MLLAHGVSAPLNAQAPGSLWDLRLDVSRDVFSGGSRDTTTIPGTEVEVTPAPRIALEVGVGRRIGPWRISLGAGYASGGLRAKTPALILEDRTGAVRRYRAALLMSRRLIGRGPASLLLLAGPAVDHWSAASIGDRTTLSCRVGLSARISLGGVAFENGVTFGLGESPFRRRDLPVEAGSRSLRTWSFGGGLRLPL